jgi:5,6-dimethylbenzimidazole synthase
LGYVNKFEVRPDLERVGWLKRTILSKVIHFEDWKKTELNNWNNTDMLIQKLGDSSNK